VSQTSAGAPGNGDSVAPAITPDGRFVAFRSDAPNLTGDDVREGLVAIISVKLAEPQFEGQTKGKLGNTEVEGVVTQLVNDALSSYLEENPKTAKTVVGKGIDAMRARDAARKARDLARRFRGEDSDGYRAEFIRLVDLASALDAQQARSSQSYR